MKTATIGTLFALLAVVTSTVAYAPAYAVHADDPTVNIPEGTGVPGCEETNECYLPPTIEVGPGTTVTWNNMDAVAHTVTSGVLTEGDPGSQFDSSLFLAGATFEHTFEETGEYPYFCIVHPWMEGVVLVTEEDHHGNGDDDHGERMMNDEGMEMMEGEDTPVMVDDGMGMMEGSDGMMEGSMGMSPMMSDDAMSMTLEGGEVMVMISSMDDPMAGEPLELALAFTNSEGMMTQHVNYDILVRQGNTVVYTETGAHDHQSEGPAMVMTRPLETSDPVDVRVTFQGFGLPGTPLDAREGPTGEMVEFEEVPEFGTIAVMVLVVAIISIVAVTSRSGVFQRV